MDTVQIINIVVKVSGVESQDRIRGGGNHPSLDPEFDTS
jgi:hypothetical protein